ncbi:MAG: hypothetical protein CVU30_09215 [Betaproteobacteria bacterium HGW-Betaproteobacteria-3]|jgi:hypothetical protein|nr:MAG: hypothetical protein CVU30_09215 [Betaproteobacteria bacterium HGW-Betaproteobacteria-3]
MRPTPSTLNCIATLLLVGLLSGCELPGDAALQQKLASIEADSRAIGGACKHAGRAIEDCYTLNPKASKSAVFAGWKEMNDYMRDNKIDVVKPEVAAN